MCIKPHVRTCREYQMNQIQILTSRNLQSYMRNKTCWFSLCLLRTYRVSGPVRASREVTMNVKTKKCTPTTARAEVSTSLPWSERERAARARVPRGFGHQMPGLSGKEQLLSMQWGRVWVPVFLALRTKGWWDTHLRVGVRKDFIAEATRDAN